MDPSLFRIDWEVLLEVLITIVVLSFFIERALSLLFEHRLFLAHFDKKGFKEPIAFVVSLAVVKYWGFDSLSVLLHADATSWAGYALTAAIIAGGSKASLKLFHDVFKTMSSSQKVKAQIAAKTAKSSG